jgi:methylmalonyl-CoA mutase C-terminal domain/subunit
MGGNDGRLSMAGRTRIRVLLGKSVYDGHERAIRYIARAFREGGMEVVLCRYRVIDEMAAIACEEDVDAIGLQAFSPGFMYDLPRLTGMLRENGMKDVLIVVGGVIPAPTRPLLKQMGVAGIFGSGSSVDEIVEFIHSNVK